MLERGAAPTTTAATLVDVLRARARSRPNDVAYTFLLEDGVGVVSLTYAELDGWARDIAARLQSFQGFGQRALLLYPPGLDYIAAFFGCLYAGVIAVPAYPPRRNRSVARLQAIVTDAEAAFVLATPQIRGMVENPSAKASGLEALHWLSTDLTESSLADEWREPPVTSQSLAFLQYTSGSTGNPKGVMLSHGNLLWNCAQIQSTFELSPETRSVFWLPPYHDMGLIGGILEPLTAGYPAYLMSPVDFLQHPSRWLKAITRFRGTLAGGPNFGFDLCARKIGPEERAGLDLSDWICAFIAAEPVRSETLDRFTAAFEPCGFRRTAFYPCYGLAEASLLVSGGKPSAPPVVRHFDSVALARDRVVGAIGPGDRTIDLVGCGQATPNQRIAIVYPDLETVCPPNEVGEIWVTGPNVGQGYWNQPEESARVFHAQVAGTDRDDYLRTGDLGFVQDDELYITGRIKDLIIIRGTNYYPQDIEVTAEESHPGLRPSSGAAVSVDIDGEERLVVIQELDREHRRPNVPEIAGAIRSAISEEYGIQAYDIVLIKQASILKTSSGKIQRQATKASYLAGGLEEIGHSRVDSTSQTEAHAAPTVTGENLKRETLLALREGERPLLVIQYLQHLVAPLAQLTTADVSPYKSLLGLGLDSLMAVELCSRVEEDLGVLIPLQTLEADQTIFQLTARIIEGLPAPPPRAT